jgi:hypothetical protein
LRGSGRNPRRWGELGVQRGRVQIQKLKGIVQRKLRGVKSGVNQWVMLQYWGARHYF